MRLHFEIRLKDYLIFNMLHMLSTPFYQAFYVGVSILVAKQEFHAHSMWYAAYTAVFTYLLMWLAALILQVTHLFFGQKNKTLLTAYSVELRDDAVLSETSFAKGEYSWNGILKCVERFGYINIYINPHAGILIPPRAFSSQDEKRRFAEFVRSKLVGACP